MNMIYFFSFSVSLAQGRSRREKKDKHGRFAALAKLKEAKSRGEKHKYDVRIQRFRYERTELKIRGGI